MTNHFDGGSKKTIAKLIILQEYLDIYTDILGSKWPKGLWYVDTHAGSGRTIIDDTTTVDGSAIRSIENCRDSFDAFYFYELSLERFHTLHETLAETFDLDFEIRETKAPGEDFMVARTYDPDIVIMQLDSNEGVQFLADVSDDQRHWFTFVDPKGLTAKRETLDQLLRRGNMDVLINYQTTGVLRAAADGASQAHDAVTRTMGDNDWPNAASPAEYVGEYETRLGDGTGFMTTSEPMVPPRGEEKYRFDLVFASAEEIAIEKMEGRMQQDNLWEKVKDEYDPDQSGLGDF